jgi:hypothetical protein
MVYTATFYAAQSSDAQKHLLSRPVNAASYAATDYFQRPTTAWAGILLQTLNKKHPFLSSKSACSLLQLPYLFQVDASGASVGAAAHLTEASFLSSRYGHYIQQSLVRQFRQLLVFLG